VNVTTGLGIAVSTLLFTLLLHFYGWKLLNLTSQEGPLFADLAATIQQSKCVWDGWLTGIGFKESISSCNYVYSILLIPFLQIIPASAITFEVLGYSLALALVASYFRYLGIESKVEKKKKLALILLFTSPPTLLLCQRGNLDALIMILIVSAMMTKKSNLGFSFLVIASVVKYYVLPAVWIHIILFGTTRKKFLVLVFFTLVAVAQLLFAQTSLPYPTDSAFGNSLSGKYLRSFVSTTFDPAINYVVDGMIGLVATYLLCRFMKNGIRLFHVFRHRKPIETQETIKLNVQKPDLILTFLILSTCYFVFSNYDYRLVWLCLLAKILLGARVLNHGQEVICLFLCFMSVWLSYPFTWLQPLGDASLLILMAYLWTLFDAQNLLLELKRRVHWRYLL
jgi:hypothetical protein